MFPRKTLLAAVMAAASVATPAAFAMPAQDLRGEAAVTGVGEPAPPTWPSHPTRLPEPVESAPLPVDGGDDEAPLLLLAVSGTLALAGGVGMASMRLRPRPAG